MGTQTIVEGRFNLAQTFAQQMYAAATTAIRDLTSQSVTVTPTPQDVTFSRPGDPPTEPDSPAALRPTYDASPEAPSEPAAIVLPTEPDIVVPNPPNILAVTVPEFMSSITLPDFTSVVPAFTLEELSVPEITALDTQYASALNDSIRAKLLANIEDGGTGLTAAVEDAIFARGTERDAIALQDASDKLTAQWAKMGFSLPDGMLSGAIMGLHEEYLNKRLDTSRDISIKQAELEQENIKYSLQFAMTLEIKMLDIADNNANRSLDAAKATVQALIQIYNSKLAAYQAQVEAYRAEAEAYKSFVQAKVAEVEVYRTKIEGQKLISEINDQSIKLFISLWEGENSKVRLYESRLRASAIEIEFNKSIIERYAEMVRAYAARSNALTAQYNADAMVYRADIDKWVARSDRDIKSADGDLRADIANVEKYLKDQDAFLRTAEWGFQLAYQKLKDTAELSAKVAAGALAGASAQASLSFSEGETV